MTHTHHHRPARRPLLALLAAALVLASVLIVVGIVGASSGEGRGDPAPASTNGLHGSQLPPEMDGRPAPNFKLTDARGGTVDTRTLRGRPYLVTFLFTRCVDACLAIGQQTRIALEKLGDDASRVTAIGVSVDPKYDTPETVQAWLRTQRLPENFHYAIGSKQQLNPTWDAYFAAPKIEDDPETSTHSGSVWLIDARGRWRTRYSAGDPIDPDDLASDLRMLIGET